MKVWQIFVVGILGLCAALSLTPLLETGGSLWGVLLAVIMIGIVAAGFALVPDRDSWQVWVTRYSYAEGEEEGIDIFSTQEPLAIRVEISRLWLLYVPTLVAVAFLVLIAVRGLIPIDITMYLSYAVLYGKWVIAGVWFLLASWIYERWLLQRAEATQAQGETGSEDHVVSYYFIVGESYYGGWGFPLFSYSEEPALAHVLIHKRSTPQHNRLVRAFLFHHFQVAGRGVQDLELAREYAAQLARQPVE